jgi:mRNA-degrading endonuclease RelE of RelBE toxin-antitoxin system
LPGNTACVQDCRIIYQVRSMELLILVVKIGQRSRVYR